jgi:hypothetical protein
MPKMSIPDLKALLAAEKSDALAAVSAARLAEERADAMDYYFGDMRKDMPAQDGRSRAVSTDVADTIEGLMPKEITMWMFFDSVVFAAGYVASIYSWPRIKLWVNGAQAEITSLEAKAAALKAVL